jgi:hypothetical protein
MNIMGISRENGNVEGIFKMKTGGGPTLCSAVVAWISSTCTVFFLFSSSCNRDWVGKSSSEIREIVFSVFSLGCLRCISHNISFTEFMFCNLINDCAFSVLRKEGTQISQHV